MTARRAIVGQRQFTYDWETGDRVEVTRAEPNVGSESLRGATMYLGNKLGQKG